MKRFGITLAASALAATALGCAWLFDSGDYEARPQTHGQAGLPEWEDNEEYLKDESNR